MKTNLLLLLIILVLSKSVLAQDQARLFADPRLKAECSKIPTPIDFGDYTQSIKSAKANTSMGGEFFQGQDLYPLVQDYIQWWKQSCQNKRFENYTHYFMMAKVIGMSFSQIAQNADMRSPTEWSSKTGPNVTILLLPGMKDKSDFHHGTAIRHDFTLFDAWLTPLVDEEWKALDHFQKEVLYKTPWDEHSTWKCKPIGEFNYAEAMNNLLIALSTNNFHFKYYQKELEDAINSNQLHFRNIARDTRPLCDCTNKKNFIENLHRVSESFAGHNDDIFQKAKQTIDWAIQRNRAQHNCP